ncbi:MAG: DUF2330 domain-containing protein [Candidatus Wallbacteria bacterium]|nr:DUF2330 domain-containing protein [Candidatus Wallbacteria bacterium]
MVRRAWVAIAVVAAVAAGEAWGACCYFSAQDRDVNQPGQKAFITWEPKEKKESFTVQPAFEGDARDFGMVIPTPSQPKLDEMPRDFFKWLAVYTILLPMPERVRPEWEPVAYRMARSPGAVFEKGMADSVEEDSLGVTVLEKGVVGSLDYKIITASDASGLFQWLKENRYKYAGDEATLDHYIRQKWFFTVMKIDAKQMKPGSGGSYQGEVTPTRFAFASEKLIYPLKITQISVKKNTEALFYVQSPEQMDLEGDWSWAAEADDGRGAPGAGGSATAHRGDAPGGAGLRHDQARLGEAAGRDGRRASGQAAGALRAGRNARRRDGSARGESCCYEGGALGRIPEVRRFRE